MALKITLFLILFLGFIITLHAKELDKINLYRSHTSQNLESGSLVCNDTLIYADFPREFNVPKSNNTFMIIQISSSETALSSDADQLLFDYFDCDPAYCSQDTSVNISYDAGWIKTTATQIYINKSISIADGAWQLKTPALYIEFPDTFIGPEQKSYGWIGLGTGSGANLNFQSENPIFSILLNSRSYDPGSLIFGFNSSIADIDKPLMVATANQDWVMQMTTLSFGSVVYTNDTNPVPVLFSLLSSGIFMPQGILTSLISQMSTYMFCSTGFCESQNLTGLPPMVFGLADGSNFSLRPGDYMIPLDYLQVNNYMSIQFKHLEKLTYYKDHIILGWDILAKFYSVFQQAGGINTISFYEIDSATPPNPEKKPSFLIIIIVGVVVTVLMCVGIIIVGVKKGWCKKKVIRRKSIVPTEVGLSESLREPLGSEERYCIL